MVAVGIGIGIGIGMTSMTDHRQASRSHVSAASTTSTEPSASNSTSAATALTAPPTTTTHAPTTGPTASQSPTSPATTKNPTTAQIQPTSTTDPAWYPILTEQGSDNAQSPDFDLAALDSAHPYPQIRLTYRPHSVDGYGEIRWAVYDVKNRRGAGAGSFAVPHCRSSCSTELQLPPGTYHVTTSMRGTWMLTVYEAYYPSAQ